MCSLMHQQLVEAVGGSNEKCGVSKEVEDKLPFKNMKCMITEFSSIKKRNSSIGSLEASLIPYRVDRVSELYESFHLLGYANYFSSDCVLWIHF